MYVFLDTRTIVKTYGPVGAPMVMVREGIDQMDRFDIPRAFRFARTVISRMTVKACGPVGAPMVMVSESTDQMNSFDIQRAPNN